ncbi:MAG: hypothetical protein NVV74_13830 [Magnetospirillum sp.]|nr:hypothetical protein [Magnetospirillum sp.]
MTARDFVQWFADQDVAALAAMAVSVGVFVLFMVRVPSGIAPAAREAGAADKPAKG